ncbi:MAG: tetratricopeptide repeat protein, partial [Burkholderiales bacterium]
MTAHRFIVLAACAALAACAQQSPRAPQDEAPGQVEAKSPRVVVAKPEPSRPPLPGVELSEELLFKMMLAEVALQRGQPHIAVQTYLELAR